MPKAKLYTHNGATHTLSQWATIAGISKNALLQRLLSGWSFDKAISTPNARYRYEYNGVKYTLSEITRMNSTVGRSGMESRLRRGMTIKDAIEIPNQRRFPNFSTHCQYDCFECPYHDCILPK